MPDTELRPITRLNQFVRAARGDGTIEANIIDVGFVKVSVAEQLDRDELVELLKACLAEPGEFDVMITPEKLCEGPSYIEVGGWIGDQTQALILFAILAHLELAKIVRPRDLGIEAGSKEEGELMGRGFLMIVPTPALRELLGVRV